MDKPYRAKPWVTNTDACSLLRSYTVMGDLYSNTEHIIDSFSKHGTLNRHARILLFLVKGNDTTYG